MMFKRQFNPPAEVPEYEGANQKVMTVEEFYQSSDFPELDKHDRKSAAFTYYDMLDFAERYAEQSAFKWINVEERLPENDTIVLCFRDGLNTAIPSLFNGGRFQVYKDVCPGDRCLVSYFCEITHWRPLPTAPKK